VNVKRVINQSRKIVKVASGRNECVIVKIEKNGEEERKENKNFDTRRCRDFVSVLKIWEDDSG
jgi:hypothetical protein